MKTLDAVFHLFNIEWLSKHTSKKFTRHCFFKILLVTIIVVTGPFFFLVDYKSLRFRRWENTEIVLLTSKDNVMSIDDLQLSDRLIQIAKNRSNRYHLHDFIYFRMIQKEFPQTDSAARIKLSSDLMPLLSTQLNSQDVLFIVMGGTVNVHKSIQIVETWLQWSKKNFFIFADADNSSVPFMTLPQLKNKKTRGDAQDRQLIGSQWLLQNKSEIVKRTKWFVFVDDDSWVNVPALFSYLELFDYRLRLSIGYLWDDTWVPGWSHFSGGAGIVLSHAAFIAMIPAIYTLECPNQRFNDVTITHCAKQKGIIKINSNRFFYNNVITVATFSHIPVAHYVSQITFHYVNEYKTMKTMTCTVAAYWKWPINGCNITYSEK